MAQQLLGAEGLFHELDEFVAFDNRDIGRDGAKTFTDRYGGGCGHGCSSVRRSAYKSRGIVPEAADPPAQTAWRCARSRPGPARTAPAPDCQPRGPGA